MLSWIAFVYERDVLGSQIFCKVSLLWNQLIVAFFKLVYIIAFLTNISINAILSQIQYLSFLSINI